MTILVATSGASAPTWRSALASRLPQDAVVTALEPGQDATVDYAVVWHQEPGLLNALPELKAVFSLGAGVDHVLSDPTLPDVPILRIVSDDLTGRMSEYIVWRVLDHLRKGRAYRDLEAAARWEDLPQPAAHALRVGILGLGELGRDAAAKLRVLGFKVSGWSRTPRRLEGVEVHSGRDGLAACLAQSDIVVVLLPLTDETRGLIDAAFLSGMKRQTPLGGPVLINAGRGGLQKDADILAALESGLLMEASLDVFEEEPLPPTSPLWRHPRCFVTPHIAAASDPDVLSALIADQITRHRAGGALTGLVDRSAGY